MKSRSKSLALGLLAAAIPLATPLGAQENAPPKKPAPPIAAMSALAFSPDGVLFVGDAVTAAVFALDLGPRSKSGEVKVVEIADIETKIAALVGTRAADVVIHDLAVDPLSWDIYLSISRNRGKWSSVWNMPNDLGNATELLRIHQDGKLEGVDLAGVAFTRADLPKPVAPGSKHQFKEGVDARTEAITDLAWDDGKLWVAGLSNEEFSSAIWRLPYPFPATPAGITTVENYHVAHRTWETISPVRSLVPYKLGGKSSLIAAYLCTPLVVYETDTLKDGAHVRGRTVSELGAGNYPLDMVVVAGSKDGPRLVIANSSLPMMSIKLADIEGFQGELKEGVETYLAGVKGDYRPAGAVQQLDALGPAHLVMLRRVPSGALDLNTWQVVR
jgi:hypothetical protein